MWGAPSNGHLASSQTTMWSKYSLHTNALERGAPRTVQKQGHIRLYFVSHECISRGRTLPSSSHGLAWSSKHQVKNRKTRETSAYQFTSTIAFAQTLYRENLGLARIVAMRASLRGSTRTMGMMVWGEEGWQLVCHLLHPLTSSPDRDAERSHR